MNSIRKSLAYSLLSSNAVTALQFFGSLIIARLLTPEQIGIFSVAAVVVALAQITRDLGVSGYIIQVKELTTEILRAAFGLALLSAGCLALALSLASGAIADFYAEPRLQEVMLVLALNFALTPFGSVTMACVRREMGFRALAMVDVLSALLSLAVTIALAYLGHGAMSLAWGAIAGTLVSVLAAQLLRPAYMPWLPGLKGASAILKFGSITTSSSILGYLNGSAADLVLGKLASMSAVAYFNRAASLNRFFGNLLAKALNPVLLPAFSNIRRQEGDISAAFLSGTALLTAVTWPLYALIAIMAEPLILLMFGDQWRVSIELVPYIALTAMLSSTYTLCGPSYVARGKPSLNLISEAINLPIKLGAIIYFAPDGVLAVAKAWPWIAFSGAVVHHIIIARELHVSPWRFVGTLWQSAAVTVVAAIGAWLPFQFIANHPATHEVTQLLAGAAGGALSWVLATSLFRHPVSLELTKARTFLSDKLRK